MHTPKRPLRPCPWCGCPRLKRSSGERLSALGVVNRLSIRCSNPCCGKLFRMIVDCPDEVKNELMPVYEREMIEEWNKQYKTANKKGRA